MAVFELSTCKFGQYVCSYILSYRDVLDVHPIKIRLHDVSDQVIVMEKSNIFNLKLVIEMTNNELGIYFAY